MKQSGDYDALIIQKKLPCLLDAFFWRQKKAPLIFDFDDAISLRDNPERGAWHSRTRTIRFGRALGIADAVVGGNDYLLSLCQGFNGKCMALPSPVPFPVPSREQFPENSVVRIGWLGSRGNLRELALLKGVLQRLSKRREFVLTVISDAEFQSEGVQVENIPWTLSGQEEALAQLDIGLMPLADTPWTRGKCSYKLLQYMAAALPALASGVGMNKEVIRHGENGFLATGDDEWERLLEKLLDNAALRRQLGKAGQQSIKENFTYEICARKLLSFCEEVASV